VKKKVSDDPRYDAVGSSSLREELFATFLKASGSIPTSATTNENEKPAQHPMDVDKEDGDVEKERKRKERQEKAVREREEKIRVERDRVEAGINKSKMGLTREEGELQFRFACL
jgi:hypothetical protein